MVKYDLGSGVLLHELELGNRIDARIPATRSPSLYDSFVRHKFHLSSRYVPAEQLERASLFTADLRRLDGQVHGLHDATQLYDFVELFGVGKRIVDALAACCENTLLVNGVGCMRNPVLCSRPSLGRMQG